MLRSRLQRPSSRRQRARTERREGCCSSTGRYCTRLKRPAIWAVAAALTASSSVYRSSCTCDHAGSCTKARKNTKSKWRSLEEMCRQGIYNMSIKALHLEPCCFSIRGLHFSDHPSYLVLLKALYFTRTAYQLHKIPNLNLPDINFADVHTETCVHFHQEHDKNHEDSWDAK